MIGTIARFCWRPEGWGDVQAVAPRLEEEDDEEDEEDEEESGKKDRCGHDVKNKAGVLGTNEMEADFFVNSHLFDKLMSRSNLTR